MAYLGKTPSQAVRQRYIFTASGSETSISGADDSGNTLTFTDGGYVDVYLNGVLLVAGTDYNTTTANTIGGLSALSASDVVEIVVYDVFSVFGGDVQGNLTISNGTLTSGDVDINGGTIDGTTIGGSTPAAGSFTTITGSGDMNIDSGTLFVDASNNRVGIGTISPTYKFEVSDGTRTGAMNPNSTLDAIFVGTIVNKPLVLGTNDVERMRISNTGDVGIGGSLTPSFTNGGGLLIYNSTIPRVELRNSTTGTSTTDGAGIAIVSDDLYMYTRDTGSNVICEVAGSESFRANGSGISFDGGSNYLDDYEEGTWNCTPSTSNSSLVPLSGWTINTQSGFYTKVGNLVVCSYIFEWSNTNSSSNRIYMILPFSVKGSNCWTGTGTEVSKVSFPSGASYVTVRPEQNGVYASFKGCGHNLSRVDMQFNNFGANSSGYALGTFSYFTDA